MPFRPLHQPVNSQLNQSAQRVRGGAFSCPLQTVVRRFRSLRSLDGMASRMVCVLFGESGAGKTCLLKRFSSGEAIT